jgi:tight adherence protein C
MDLIGALSTIGENSTLVLALLVLSGCGLAAMGLAGAVQGRGDIRRRTTTGLAEAPSAPPSGGRTGGGARAEAQASLHRLAHFLETTFSGGDPHQNKLIRLQLVQAGFFDQRAIALFFAARLGTAFSFALGAFLIAPLAFSEPSMANRWLAAAGVGIAGYFAPSIYLKRRIAKRVDQHRMGFPDFMDLMVVCAEAGLSMEAAIERIARELVEGYPSLAENLYMVSLEIRAGKAFADALERMGERLGIEEATMLATLLQQSAELGTSLSQSLRVYSEEMRNKRMSRAEEKAYALPAKLVVPLTLFVFPVLIVTLMYPAVIRMMDVFGAK